MSDIAVDSTETLTEVASEEQVTPAPVISKMEDPFEVAATMMGMYTHKFNENVNGLSTGELRRLVKAIVQYPINDKEFIDQTSSQMLKDTFLMGDRLNQAKWMLIQKTLMDEHERLQKEEASKPQNEMENVENGEVKA